jgi:hypothetical protein
MVRRPPHTACLGMRRATEQPVEADAAHRLYGEKGSTSASTLGPLAIAFCCCHTPAARAARHAWLRPRG